MPYARVNKYATEEQEQITVIDWILAKHPWLKNYTIHIKNERKCTISRGLRNKRLGVLAGASDLFIAVPRGQYHGLFIEVKSMIGKPTESQLTFITRMNAVDYYACWLQGATAIIDKIEWYLSLS